MHTRQLLIVFVVMAIAAAGNILLTPAHFFSSPPLAGKNNSDIFAIRAMWANRIDEVGPEQAYQEYKTAYQSQVYVGIRHSIAHQFGALLYEKMGLAGVTVCDKAYSFGCYHSFFGVAVSRHGLGVVPALANECIKKWGLNGLACPHGLGHGILSYLGNEHLKDALNTCASLPWKASIGGCAGGVFMEYNFNTMRQEDGAPELRPYRADDPYAPCSFIASQFREACYFEEPEWWAHVFEGDYSKIGILCQGVAGQSEREACFLGAGKVIAEYSAFYDVTQTRTLCVYMPSSDTVTWCRAGAYASFHAVPEYRARAQEVCESGDTGAKLCVARAVRIRDVMQ